MISLKHPDISVTLKEFSFISGDTETLDAELYLGSGEHREFCFMVADGEFFVRDVNEPCYYELHVKYDRPNCEAKNWVLKLDITDVECNDFTFKEPNETEDIIRFIEKILLTEALGENLTDKPEPAKTKSKKI